MAEKEYTPTNWVNDSEPDIDAEHLNNIEEGIDGLYKPEFDDSGTVEGITSFPEFLRKIVTKMNSIAFYKNFKAGMKFVLHTGQLVNNGLCNEPGKYPLDAAYGKTLADQVTKLNSDLRTKAEVLLQSFLFSIVIPAQGYAFVDITITIPDGSYLGTFTVFGGESRNAVSLGAVLISDTVISVEGHNGFTSELTVPGNVNVLFFRQP